MTPKRKPALPRLTTEVIRGVNDWRNQASHADPMTPGQAADRRRADAWWTAVQGSTSRPPLPRAVRELLREIVILRSRLFAPFAGHADDIGGRAAALLGTTCDDIVAKARKAGRR